MAEAQTSTDKFVFTSSVAAEAWHASKSPQAYEWWYFDALSDDGKEAVAIVFLDNFVYSPGFSEERGGPESLGAAPPIRPAVSFTYFADGKVAYQAKTGYAADRFSASESEPKCRIGDSGFRFDSASYGRGYLVSVDLPLSGRRRLRANFEWLAIESDLLPETGPSESTSHCWNMVAPRCDVSGKITIEDPQGRHRETRSFRGTGYHDHNLDDGWLFRSVKEWHWGRVHFADSTAVFCQFSEIGAGRPQSRVLIKRDGGLQMIDAVFDGDELQRDGHSVNRQGGFSIASEGLRLDVRPLRMIDANFYHKRFLSLITLNSEGREHSANGISETVAPRALRYRWLSWLNEFRTSRNGRTSTD